MMSLAATANSMPTETVSPTDYDCRSLPLTKRLSTKKKRDKNFSSPAKKCGSVEEISFTGTQVSEIPDNFSILLDPITLTGMVDMDLLKQNGMSDHIRRKVEGKVDPNTIKNKRLSIRRPKDDECTDFSDKNGSELEDSALGTSLIVHTSKIEVNVEGDSNRDPPLTPSVDTLKEMQLLHHNGIRTSTASTDSGIDHVTQGMSTENFPTESGPARDANVTLTPSFKTLSPRPSPFDSPKYRMNSHRESMLLSQLCIVTVTVPAEVHQGHKGKGASLKFRFSPYTQIESLRLAILKQFHDRFEVTVDKLSRLHLCRYLEDEEGWEYLEEDQALHNYNLPTEFKLELKALEPLYSDVRVVIPQLECSLSVQYDQFSLVGDVLHQVLELTQPQLNPRDGYILYHVRLRLRLDSSESMVHYDIQPGDVLECRLSKGALHEQTVILTIKIPAVQSSRKVKVYLDETVGELMSTLMRRVPEPESTRWAHMSLYLRTKDSSVPGIWMEDYKFLAAYKLKATDVIEFRPKYRPMKFELRVYPHDHDGDNHVVYATPELLIAQDSYVSDVIDLLCNSCSLEYDPRLYGLYLHDDQALPNEMSMWDYLDDTVPGYQDSLVLHMVHKPIIVALENEQDSVTTLNVDFSQPSQVVRDILCRRYGSRHHNVYGLRYEGNGITLNLFKSLHNQGVLEQEKITLIRLQDTDIVPVSPTMLLGGDALETSSSSMTSISSQLSQPPGSRDSIITISDEECDCNIWDELESQEAKIRYDKKRPGVVVGASFNRLVEKITSVTDHDIEFVKTFLLTYQSFATPDRLLKKLIERYNVVRPQDKTLTQFTQMRQTIQARVINALRLWVEYGVDFKDNISLQNNILMFISTVLVFDHPKLCRPLRTNILSIRGIIQKKNLKIFIDPPPPVKLPLNPGPVLSVFDFDPEEIARQLTMIDYSLFAKIKPAELLNQAWQKPKYKHRAQNILRIVERMNNLTLWVATTILSQKDVQQRAKRITDFVQICVHLHQMNNYCTLMALLNGLAHHSINRLSKSSTKVDKNIRQKLNEMQDMARPGNNYQILRDELKKASNPCIPYLGLYMSDLTFLDNGNPNYHADSLINFSKCRLIYHQIRDLILRQDKSYNFEEVPALRESLLKFAFLDDDTLYEVSLQREPKDKK